MSTKKLSVIEWRLILEQSRFMPSWSNIEAIHILDDW